MPDAALALANRWQRGFPLEPHPFAAIGKEENLSEESILDALTQLKRQGAIDRVGPVFRPNTVGASTLAAMAVPPRRLEAVAAVVSAQANVNHNYERDHEINLWFVVTATDARAVEETLAMLERETGLPVLRLPLREEFHVDLGFDLERGGAPREAAPKAFPPLAAGERELVAASAPGLPLVPEPYKELARKISLGEEQVISGLKAMLADGRIRRIGAVVRHRHVGYDANAMAVWDVPDDEVAKAGRALAAEPAVTLCYRRARALPQWPYNLYCMVHGQERSPVRAEVERLSRQHGLTAFAHAVLFSRRCFSQRAARYG
jgi:DNA-binding Lrp family transcriptional regulator